MKSTNTARTPEEFLSSVDKERAADVRTLHELIQSVSPKLTPYIQSGMLGYGKFHYRYESGREGDWSLIALSPRKNYLSLYVLASDGKTYVAEKYKDRLPKADIGKSCVRFKKLSDVDQEVLRAMIAEAVALTPGL